MGSLMRVSEYVAEFIAGISPRVYGVSGGMAMYLNDALAHHPKIKFIATHHEQAATFAAEADARVTNSISVVHVTAGPGVTNTATGVASAWADSIPIMIIAGQVERRTLKGHSGVRQLGISEVDGPAILGPITKYAVTVNDPLKIKYHLEMAEYLATTGRKGPVFLEIPIDVQSAEINPKELVGFDHPAKSFVSYSSHILLKQGVRQCVDLLRQAKRPVMIIGNGVRLAGAEKEFADILKHKIPVLCSWSAADLISSDHPLYVGRPGIIGDRAGNFAIQRADFIIAVGTRLSIPQIGHHWKLFAPDAKLVMVDIDVDEIKKPTLSVALGIPFDAKQFLRELNVVLNNTRLETQDWACWCQAWKLAYPVILPEYAKDKDGVNAYYFLDQLAKNVNDDAIIVTDVGTSFVCTMQAMPMTGKQRMFHTPGIASMGYGLPAAVGACMASGGRQVICLTGDGGAMFNLQELQTIVTHKLPIAIFLFANRGYKTMQVTQETHFKRHSVSTPSSDIGWPDFGSIAEAFGMATLEINGNSQIAGWVKSLSKIQYPTLCQIHLSKNNCVMPLVKSKMENGKFIPVSIEDMWPQQEKGFANVVERLDESRQKVLAAN